MADIKTKDTIKGTIKQLDRAAIASDRMKRAYIQTKDKAENSVYASEATPEQYAADHMESGAQSVSYEAGHQAQKIGRNSIPRAKENIQEAKQAFQEFQKVCTEQKETRIKTRETVRETATGEKSMSQNSAPKGQQRQQGLPRTVQRESMDAGTPDTGRAVEQGRKRVEQTARTKQWERAIRTHSQANRSIKTLEQPAKQVKETARSAGKKSIKTTQKVAAKTAQRGVKTAERTAKTTIKTSKEVAKAAEKSAKTTAKAAQKAAQAAKATAKAVAASVKAAVKVTIAAIKAIIAATKALVSAIVAGGWVAVLVIVIIMLIALLAGSVFGIFFSGEDSGTGLSMPMVVKEINADYDAQLEAEKASVSYDYLEMSGSRAVWKEVLAVYAVKINTDPDNPQEVATMDDSKKQLLSDIFWEMNSISSHTETDSTTVTTETDDGHGNIITTETTETTTTLYITVSHKTVDEMATQYGFTQQQKDYLADLLKDENNQLWSTVLYGIGYSDDQIVTVALSQIGNYGGEPYWSWYGFGSRVEWCACFVSWCANECGYIDNGVIPKFAGRVLGTQWFKDRGQWMDNSAEPAPGMIIFFDWDNPSGSSGPQDGEADHVGIVEKVENGTVYTVEGNSGDSVRINTYPVGYYEILGYGVPQY